MGRAGARSTCKHARAPLKAGRHGLDAELLRNQRGIKQRQANHAGALLAWCFSNTDLQWCELCHCGRYTGVCLARLVWKSVLHHLTLTLVNV